MSIEKIPNSYIPLLSRFNEIIFYNNCYFKVIIIKSQLKHFFIKKLDFISDYA